jgi:Streptomyces sporulation and cell division protein, SsgA
VDIAHPPSSGHSCPLTLRLIGPYSLSKVSALFSYDARDPFAVRIEFGGAGSGTEDGVTWLIGRELLRAGLDQPTGDGDVRVGPGAGTDVVFLCLRAPSGEALMELSRAALAVFLACTESLVPFGAEEAAIDLDDELVVLLSDGGADPTSR